MSELDLLDAVGDGLDCGSRNRLQYGQWTMNRSSRTKAVPLTSAEAGLGSAATFEEQRVRNQQRPVAMIIVKT